MHISMQGALPPEGQAAEDDAECPVAEGGTLLPAGAFDLRATWQVASMSLGIGVFSIPSCFLSLGTLQGTIWIVVMGIFSNAAQQRLLDLAASEGKTSYEALAEEAFGGFGKFGIAIITLVTTFAGAVSHLDASKELFIGVAYSFMIDIDIGDLGGGSATLGRPRCAVFLLALASIICPPLLAPTMEENVAISMGTVFGISFSSLYFVVKCFLMAIIGCDVPGHCGKKPNLVNTDVSKILTNVATLAFSFSSIFAIFPVLQDRIQRTGSIERAVQQMKPAVRWSTVLCCMVYLSVGLAGVYAFGTKTDEMALQNLDLKHPLPLLCNFVVAVGVLLVSAIIAFPCIQTLEMLRKTVNPSGTVNLRPVFVACVGLLAALIDAYLDTKLALALTGSLGLALASYAMPCALFLKLSGRAAPAEALVAAERGSGYRRSDRLLAGVVLLFGLIVLFGSTPITVYNIVTSNGGASNATFTQLSCKLGQDGVDCEGVPR